MIVSCVHLHIRKPAKIIPDNTIIATPTAILFVVVLLIQIAALRGLSSISSSIFAR